MKSKRLITVAAFLTMLACPPLVCAETITLTGTIRDFTTGPGNPNPDFESTISGLAKGMVQRTLGADGKPVYIAPLIDTEHLGGTHGKSYFDEWYNSTVMTIDFSINLEKTSSGDYACPNESFFPIDNQLLGNEGLDHNYHFTYEAHSRFTYERGQTLSVAGDDDIWVFIDGQLAIDLGGIHSAVEEFISLDSLGLVPGNNYSFDLFFAERYPVESTLTVRTPIKFNLGTSDDVRDPAHEQIQQPVPEPSTLLLLGAGLGGLVIWRRRK